MARFAKGKSGNPRGRPRDATHAQFRARVRAALPDVLDTLVRAALAGDMAAARLLLDRCLPPLRPVDSPVALPAMSKAQTLTDKARAIVDAAATGELTPTEAATLMQALSGLARATEVDELAKRIEALERGANHGD